MRRGKSWGTFLTQFLHGTMIDTHYSLELICPLLESSGPIICGRFDRSPALRIGIYEPGTNIPLILSRPFKNCRRDRRLLAKAAELLLKDDVANGLAVGIFSDSDALNPRGNTQ